MTEGIPSPSSTSSRLSSTSCKRSEGWASIWSPPIASSRMLWTSSPMAAKRYPTRNVQVTGKDRLATSAEGRHEGMKRATSVVRITLLSVCGIGAALGAPGPGVAQEVKEKQEKPAPVEKAPGQQGKKPS